MIKYTPIIGLEVHVELKTKSKMFCGCSADYFGKEPNTHTCPVCLGLPGALPVPNKQAIEWCIMIAQALNCEVAEFSKFDRKNYFYPDLPKGYQISQYDLPFGVNGYMNLNKASVILGSEATPASFSSDSGRARMTKKRIRIRRVHMEEDTAKLTHQFGTQNENLKTQNDKNISLVDFNRSGVPLVEIVTEPDFNSAEEVTEYLQRLRQIVRYLGVSNADMEKGDMRLEPNISLSPLSLRGVGDDEAISYNMRSPRSARDDKDFKLPSYKVEVKNINSFRFVAQAIAFEVKRQAEILDRGETPPQETRGWNETKQITISQRVKEEANDYRYFPEPDIPPFRFSESQIADIKSQMPPLQEERIQTYINLGTTPYQAEQLTRTPGTASYFDQVVQYSGGAVSPSEIANYMINTKFDMAGTAPSKVVDLIKESKTKQDINISELQAVINEVLSEHVKAVDDYKNGKEASLMFLLGQTMRKIGKKVDATLVKEKLIEKIKQS